MRKIGLVLLLTFITGCATGVPGSARHTCHKAGLEPGTSEFTNCWTKIRDQQLASDLDAIVGIGLLTVLASPAPAPAHPAPVYNAPLVHNPPASQQPLHYGQRPGAILCPDGSYVYGVRCLLTPGGTYVGAPQ